MGKATGFKEFTRETPNRFPVDLRLNNFNEFYEDLDTTTAETQGARCMNCAVPFCMSGCPPVSYTHLTLPTNREV